MPPKKAAGDAPGKSGAAAKPGDPEEVLLDVRGDIPFLSLFTHTPNSIHTGLKLTTLLLFCLASSSASVAFPTCS